MDLTLDTRGKLPPKIKKNWNEHEAWSKQSEQKVNYELTFFIYFYLF